MWVLHWSPTHEAQVERLETVEALRRRLAYMGNAEFRERVDSVMEDTEELVAARQEACELVRVLRREGELDQAQRIAQIGADEAGGRTTVLRQIRSEADYERVNDADFDRTIRLGARARDHALALTVADHLAPDTFKALALPSVWFERSAHD